MYLPAVPPIASVGQMETTIPYVLGVRVSVSPTTTKIAKNNANMQAALMIVNVGKTGITIGNVIPMAPVSVSGTIPRTTLTARNVNTSRPIIITTIPYRFGRGVGLSSYCPS